MLLHIQRDLIYSDIEYVIIVDILIHINAFTDFLHLMKSTGKFTLLLYVDLIVYSSVADRLLVSSYLFIQELPGVLLYVPLIQVCSQTHQTHLREAEVCELDVTH